MTNNIIYDLVPGELNEGNTPSPPTSLGMDGTVKAMLHNQPISRDLAIYNMKGHEIYAGSCIAAGYSSCCEDDVCLGDIGDCYCDEFCYNLGDCCTDLSDICLIGKYTPVC